MKRRFRLTREASADLREILLDIATDSPDAAEGLRSEFYGRCNAWLKRLDSGIITRSFWIDATASGIFTPMWFVTYGRKSPSTSSLSFTVRAT